MATWNPPGIAGESAGRTALEGTWCRPHWRDLSSVVTRTLSGILNSSVPPLSGPSVSPQTVPQLTRMTAGGTVMFELESLVIQHFGSRHAFFSWHSIAEFGAGIPARSPRTNFCWTSWVLSFRKETRANAQDKNRASHGSDGPPLQGQDGHMPSIWYCSRGVWKIILRPVGHPTALEEIWRGTSPAQSQQWVQVGDADTLWRPHFFSAVTFESQRSPELRLTALLFSNCCAPSEPVLRYSSRLLLLHYAAYPAFHRMVWGWDSDEIAENQHKFFQFLSLQ